MPGVILRTLALKVVNKGGGRKCKTERLGGGWYRTHYGQKEKGTDYIVFDCPGCAARNKRSVYAVKGAVGSAISFKCHHCYREIEVERPMNLGVGVMPPLAPSGLVDQHGRPL